MVSIAVGVVSIAVGVFFCTAADILKLLPLSEMTKECVLYHMKQVYSIHVYIHHACGHTCMYTCMQV